MINTNNMIKSKALWAGLNCPHLTPAEADIVVLGIPFDGGVSFRSGAKDAPKALREITYTIPPTTELFESFSELKIVDIGDIGGKQRSEIFNSVEEYIVW